MLRWRWNQLIRWHWDSYNWQYCSLCMCYSPLQNLNFRQIRHNDWYNRFTIQVQLWVRHWLTKVVMSNHNHELELKQMQFLPKYEVRESFFLQSRTDTGLIKGCVKVENEKAHRWYTEWSFVGCSIFILIRPLICLLTVLAVNWLHS